MLDFIADNGISDSKSVSKAIGLKPHVSEITSRNSWKKANLSLRASIRTGNIR